MAKEAVKETVKAEKTKSFIPEKGEKIKVVSDSKHYDKTTTAPGINANKKARFGA